MICTYYFTIKFFHLVVHLVVHLDVHVVAHVIPQLHWLVVVWSSVQRKLPILAEPTSHLRIGQDKCLPITWKFRFTFIIINKIMLYLQLLYPWFRLFGVSSYHSAKCSMVWWCAEVLFTNTTINRPSSNQITTNHIKLQWFHFKILNYPTVLHPKLHFIIVCLCPFSSVILLVVLVLGKEVLVQSVFLFFLKTPYFNPNNYYCENNFNSLNKVKIF